MSSEFINTLGLSPGLCKVLKDIGYAQLTPIQQDSIGLLLEGKDVIGQAQTGSGKTAAFSIPILEKIQTKTRILQALVLCPTRELGLQVAEQMRRLGRYQPNLFIVPLLGGNPFRAQMRSIEHGVHIVVGTPGRILDHLQRQTVDFANIKTVVLDEADRMLDMGFRDDIEEILKHVPQNRQTVLFSATFPPTIEGLSKRYQKDPVRIIAKALEAPAIEERFYETSYEQKMETLLSYVQAHPPESAIIFCNTKIAVDELYQGLRTKRLSAEKLHGDMEQPDRVRVMAKFRNQTARILVATDVAARGIDVSGVEMVINYDLPSDPEVYVHRIGRTGRIGKPGLAVSFFKPMESAKVKTVENYTKRTFQKLKWDLSSEPQEIRENKMETLYIGGGRKQKVRPTDILGALTGEGGCKADQVGKIEILDNFTYVAVSREVSNEVVTRLKAGKIKGRRFQVEKVK